jgi:hypothetical protein
MVEPDGGDILDLRRTEGRGLLFRLHPFAIISSRDDFMNVVTDLTIREPGRAGRSCRSMICRV